MATTLERTYSADWLASKPLAVRRQLLAQMPDGAIQALQHSYEFWARESQREPTSNWHKWLLLGGRGAGKTWTGSNVTNRRARSGRYPKILIAAATPQDARDLMIEGESGILATAAPDFRPFYEPSKLRITWPNGCRGYIRSGAEPERFRGINSYFAWLDELAAWQYPQQAFDNAMLGLRLGPKPQVVITTTPKPIPLIKALTRDPSCVITRDSSRANRANLAESFWADVIAKYEGTRLGRQEIEAEVVEDTPGALWPRYALIDDARVTIAEFAAIDLEHLGRVIVAVDPAVTSSDNANETGIIVAVAGRGAMRGHSYILRDVSGRYSPSEWAKHVTAQYHMHRADRVVAEVNNGGDLVESTLRVHDPNISYRGVHAARGKRTRAEPVVGLYEQGRVHHVGTFTALEEQMTTFVPDERSDGSSPDRVDALVWALTALQLGPKAFVVV